MDNKVSKQNNIIVEDHWLQQLEGAELISLFDTETTTQTDTATKFKEVAITLPEDFISSVAKISKGDALNKYVLFITALNLLLARYTNRYTNIISIPHFNTDGSDKSSELLVFFKTQVASNEPVKNLLNAVLGNLNEIIKNQEFDFDNFLNRYKDKNVDDHALFEVGFFYDKVNNQNKYTRDINLLFCIEEKDGNLRLKVRYNSVQYSEKYVSQLGRHFCNTLISMLQNIQEPTKAVKLLSAEEEAYRINHIDDTYVAIDEDITIQEVFENQVNETPNVVAITYGGTSMTYSELNEVSNKLANNLITSYNIKRGDVISIWQDTSESLIIAMLGILKAGATFLPIAADTPKDRIAYILEDAAVKLLLTDSTRMFDAIENFSTEIFALDIQLPGLEDSGENLQNKNRASDIAYIIYTSGTTGKPKGVKIKHESLHNYAYWLKSSFNLSENDSSILLSSYAFDLGYTAIWGSLLSGGKLHLVDDSFIKEISRLPKYITDNNITFIKGTPSLFYMIMQSADASLLAKSNLRLIVLGGEEMRITDVKKFQEIKPDVVFVNHYGPTESTIGCIAHILDTENLENFLSPPIIGRPINNVKAYVLDEHLAIVPFGVSGELYIAGAGLSEGYVNNEALTRERFIENPFRKEELVYKTGDRVKRLADGTIQFLGRVDRQVKIKGYRVELREIENVLKSKNDIEDVIVIDRKDTEDIRYLVAYLKGSKKQSITELRDFINKSLPEYMIPSHFVEIAEFPLTANGKIDYKALPDPAEATLGTSNKYTPPTTPLEQKITEIWEEVLGKAKIGIKDNYFELGGDSLKGIRVVNKLQEYLNKIVHVSLLFDASTIQELALELEEYTSEYKEKAAENGNGESSENVKQRANASGIQPIDELEYYDVSYAQKRLWIIDLFEKGKLTYSQPRVYELTGKLNIEAFKKTFKTLVQRHESLRTTFISIDGVPKQQVHAVDTYNFKVEYQDLRNEENPEKSADTIINKQVIVPFDLEKGPLLKVSLLQTRDEKFIFLFMTHHIISDGWSIQVLMKEMLAIYNCYKNNVPNKLEPLTIQYKDFAAWQNEQLHGELLKGHQEYWLNKLSGEIPILNLSTTWSRPAVKTDHGDKFEFTLAKELSAKVRNLAKSNGVTLYMMLLASVKALLYKYTGQEDIVIGSPIAGRNHSDLENQIGFYINTLALRTKFSQQENFNELLKKVKETMLGAYKHQIYPFDKLIEDLKIERDPSRSPVFDIAVVMQDNYEDSDEIESMGDIEIESYDTDFAISFVDMKFNFKEQKEGLEVSINYNSDLFSEEQMQLMHENYKVLLENIVQQPEQSLQSLEYLTKKEKDKILVDFNSATFKYPVDQTISQIIEQQAAIFPNQKAVVYGNVSLTYSELNKRANKLAHYLRESANVKRGDFIGILLDRSEQVIVSILAILKAGAAYVPVDTQLPPLRKEYLLENSGVKILLTDSNYIFDLEYYKGELFAIDLQLDDLEEKTENLSVLHKPEDPAYVIFTSGSTGNPKGVVVKQHSNINMSFDQIREFGIISEDRILQFASLSFDASVYEIFMALYAGATLVIADRNTINDSDEFIAYLKEKEVTQVTLPPSYLATLDLDKLTFLRVIVTAGEACNVKDAVRCSEFSDYYNAYGPTECAVCISTYKVHAKDKDKRSMPIGKPVGNMKMYVLNSSLQPVAIGQIGEIYASGIGLAKEYLGQPELTNEKFLDNPFEEGSKMYATGDLGKWLSSGDLEYIGRKDSQVKIRGHRIELGEVEYVLQKNENLENSAVIVKKDANGDAHMKAFYSVKKGQKARDLKGFMATYLPVYMIPSFFVELPELPINSNGKVDKKRLASEEENFKSEKEFVPPRNSYEEAIVEIWKEILDIDKISVTDSFFDLGGHSIKAIKLSNLLKEKFKIEVDINMIFTHHILEDLAKEIEMLCWFQEEKQTDTNEEVVNRISL